MRSIASLLIILLLQSCAQNSKDPVEFEQKWVADAANYSLDAAFIQELKDEQRALLGKLTGHITLEDGQKLTRRWSVGERTLTRDILKRYVRPMGLKPQELPYIMNLPQLNKRQNPATGTNMHAIIPSTVPSDEYIVIGAHYDSVKEAPGASDNASGCTLVYGVAKALLQQTERSKNVMIVFFDKEEVGHAGATAFAEFLTLKKYDVHSVHTIDQVGWDDDGDRNIELELPSPELKEIYQQLASSFDIKAYRTRETGSDHKELREAGFNAVGITEEYRNGDTSPYHHDPGDTFETIDFDYLHFVTYFIFKAVMEIMAE